MNGKFITYPYNGPNVKQKPWESWYFNNKDIKLPAGDGLLTLGKNFTPKSGLCSAELKISSLGIFEALLNGKRIGRNGEYDELCPLWTDYKHRVFVYKYDLIPYIKTNMPNRFTARVSDGWWAGRISFGYYGFKHCALCAEIILKYKDGSEERISTDESWDSAVAGPVLNADIWDGQYIDSRIPDPAQHPETVDWKPAVEFTDYECTTVPFEGEYVKVNECMSPVSSFIWKDTKDNGTKFGEIVPVRKAVGDGCEVIKLKAGQKLTLDFGEDIVGRPVIEVLSHEGAEIECFFAEMLNDSGDEERGNDGPKGSVYIKNYRTALSRLFYITSSSASRKRINTIRPLHTFYGFRYIEINTSRDINILSVKAEVLGSALKPLGSFECSNAEINKLYKNIVRGMKGNYLSIPTDCPQRDERLGWTGDTQIFCRAGAYLADNLEFMRKWLGDARDSQKGQNGEYCDVIPRVFGEPGHGANTAWADAGLIVPYQMWQMFGDTSIVEENYDAMEEYMTRLEKNGFDGPTPTYGDWLCYEPTDGRYISVCYYAYDAYLMTLFSHLLGKKDREEYYEKLHKDIVGSFRDRYLENGVLTESSQTAYLLALAFDLLPKEAIAPTVKLLDKKIKNNGYTLSTGFVGTGILNQTLSKVGLSNTAYSLLLQTNDPSWLYSVRQGATTIWERWNSYTIATGFGDVGMNSFNHYAYGAVAEWMYAEMAGIKVDPECPGINERFVLAPEPDTRSPRNIPEGQKRIEMVHATYKGIESRWEYENGRFVWRFKIPRGKARVEFPILYGQKTFEVNGVSFSARELGGKIIKKKLVFELGKGEYTIR